MGEKRFEQATIRTNRKNSACPLDSKFGKKLRANTSVPGYKPHSLSGDLKGFWSVWITGDYRVYFRFEDGKVFDINYSDYH